MSHHISTNPDQLDVVMIHRFLSEESSWARGIPIELVARSIRNSLNFGLFQGGRQVGYARVVTDQATFAYLMDVFVLPEARGHGLSLALMEAVMQHPSVGQVRRFVLVSSAARGLYERFGFAAPAKPETFMEINRPNTYLKARAGDMSARRLT